MKDKTIRIPYFTCWPLKKSYPPDGVAVMVAPSKAIEWALCRIMGDCVLAGKEIFFHPYSNLVDLSTEEDTLNPLPFYLGSLVSRIKTNDRRSLKNLLYDFGEFEMETEVEELLKQTEYIVYRIKRYEQYLTDAEIHEATSLASKALDIIEKINEIESKQKVEK